MVLMAVSGRGENPRVGMNKYIKNIKELKAALQEEWDAQWDQTSPKIGRFNAKTFGSDH